MTTNFLYLWLVDMGLISPYFFNVVAQQISISVVLYSHIIPIVISIPFGIFLLLKTKKLSSFYLFLVCLGFSIFTLLDFFTWVLNPWISIFSWSLFELFSTLFFIFSYWFLYVFVKERDLPMWQKVATALTLLPTLYITILSINMKVFLITTGVAIVNQSVLNFNSLVQLFFIGLVVWFTTVELRKQTELVGRNKVLLSGIGVATFLLVFFVAWGVTNFLILIKFGGTALSSYIYNYSLYSYVSMPILLGFLGYLIAKYQAFDVKLIKSIALIVILMVILFFGLFFA